MKEVYILLIKNRIEEMKQIIELMNEYLDDGLGPSEMDGEWRRLMKRNYDDYVKETKNLKRGKYHVNSPNLIKDLRWLDRLLQIQVKDVRLLRSQF